MGKLGGLGAVLGEQRAPLCPFSRSMQLCARPHAKPSEKGIELDFNPHSGKVPQNNLHHCVQQSHHQEQHGCPKGTAHGSYTTRR